MLQGSRANRALGYAQATVNTATPVGSLTFSGQAAAGIPQGTAFLLVIPEAQAVRYRDDGVDPTAAIGMPLAVGQVLNYDASDFARLRFIAQTAGGIVNITAYSAA